jgi:zinc D-Ala-D-Ala dipeptidase
MRAPVRSLKYTDMTDPIHFQRALSRALVRSRAAGTIPLLAAVIACGSTQPRVAGAALVTPSDSIAHDSLAVQLLADVQELAPAIAVELRYGTADNFTGAPLPGYTANRAFLRREAAVALARLSRQLADSGLGLKIYDAYRPARATAAMVEWARRTGRMDLFRDGYISSRSRHNLGLAVDLTLVDLASGRELDMGTSWDTFSEAAHTANASGQVAANRQRLVRAMSRAGFVNYPREWWHFSFQLPDEPRFDWVIR